MLVHGVLITAAIIETTMNRGLCFMMYSASTHLSVSTCDNNSKIVKFVCMIELDSVLMRVCGFSSAIVSFLALNGTGLS